jgi:hypothetical protein
MTIPYRDEQILRILADNPTGLTTGQILAIAKTQRGNELPDSNITSQRIYALRETKQPKVESLDTADGRKHKITTAGRDVLAEIDRNNPFAAKPVDAEHPAAQPMPSPEPASSQPSNAQDIEQSLKLALANNTMPDQDHEDPIDIIQQFDQAVAIIREGLVAALNAQADPIKIVDKRVKIELLEKLENMPYLEIWAAEMIAEIRVDLDQLESA